MMRNYTSITDLQNLEKTIQSAIHLKKHPFQFQNLGKHKTLVMIFFNSSLRTRLSTEKAAKNLGLDVMILNIKDTWQLEFEDGTVMDTKTTEHIKEAAHVISQFADIIAVRAFPSLKDKQKDEAEIVLQGFVKHANVPIINMESSTAHPLQALTDAISIIECKQNPKPNVVLSWAPHPKALPQSVPNSFVKMMRLMNVNFSITHPQGYNLNPNITKKTPIIYNQNEAIKNADFVYVKNWSSYQDYGKILSQDKSWMMSQVKLKHAKFMHCLPVRRNVIVEDAVLDSENSMVIQQANNRTYAAQAVIKEILENN
jgi:N-succinyl-L-ornithine transcarbamylase